MDKVLCFGDFGDFYTYKDQADRDDSGMDFGTNVMAFKNVKAAYDELMQDLMMEAQEAY